MLAVLKTTLLSSSSLLNEYKILPMYNIVARTATAFLSRGDFNRPRLYRTNIISFTLRRNNIIIMTIERIRYTKSNDATVSFIRKRVIHD